MDGVGLENRTGRHMEALGMAEGDDVKMFMADDHADSLECDDPGWSDAA